MFLNVLMTGLTPLRNTNEIHCWENRPFTTIWPDVKQEKLKDTTINKTIKKKNKRNRTIFTTEQLRVLENIFTHSKYIDVERRKEIAECLQMNQKCIKIWFQNRRMKEKKDSSETSDSASERVADSVSPPLEASQSGYNAPNNHYLHSYVNGYANPQYNNYYSVEDQRNAEITDNFVIPEYTNFTNLNCNGLRNNIDCSTQYYTPQPDLKYYYNMGEANNQDEGYNAQGMPANIFDTSYL